MIIEIDNNYTGLKQNIYYDTKKDILIKNYSLMSYNFSSINNSIFNNKFISYRKKYSKIISKLNIKDMKNISWHYFLNKKDIKLNFNNIIKDLKNLDKNDISYIETLSQRYELTDKIKDPLFKDKIERKRPEYNHTSTITGRSVIKKGYNFLTSKKSERCNLVSRYVLGNVYEIDIKSLEPRLLMHMNGEKYVEDIYSHFKNLLNLKAERKKIKLAVISIMYGSSLRNAENLTGIDRKDLKKIYEHLKIEEWKQKLINERKELGYIVNPYGKKIYQDGPLINYYFQSAGADCASLAFNNMIEENFMSMEFSLIASIHDAVIIDIGWEEKSLINKVEEIDHIYCSVLDIKLPVTIKGLSNEKETN